MAYTWMPWRAPFQPGRARRHRASPPTLERDRPAFSKVRKTDRRSRGNDENSRGSIGASPAEPSWCAAGSSRRVSWTWPERSARSSVDRCRSLARRPPAHPNLRSRDPRSPSLRAASLACQLTATGVRLKADRGRRGDRSSRSDIVRLDALRAHAIPTAARLTRRDARDSIAAMSCISHDARLARLHSRYGGVCPA